MLRHQLPVYSPVTWEATTAGIVAALFGSSDRGARVQELLRARYGSRDAVLTDSGTSALHLAIAGVVGATGRPVALPGYGCYDLATAAEGARAPVALYDVDALTLGPDWNSVESLRRLEPIAIVVAHWFGQVADVLRAGELFPDSVLIEDAAQGVGGYLRGRPCGSFGSVSVLSFGRGKGTTGGGGGALLAHDERGEAIVAWARGRLQKASRGLGSAAGLVAQLIVGRPSVYGLPASLPFLRLGETVYHPPRPPRETTAASLSTLARIWEESEREVATRRAHAVRLGASLAASASLRPVLPLAHAEPGYLRLPAMAKASAADDLLPSGRSLGVARGYPRTLASLPSLRPLLANDAALPGATALAAGLMTIPTHRLLEERDLAALERWLAGH